MDFSCVSYGRRLDIRGVSRSRRVRTTVPDEGARRPSDLVERDFTADRPNRLWVTDLTFVSTWQGVAYVCFIVEAFSRRIVAWVGCSTHAHRNGPRRTRDGTLVTRHSPRRASSPTPMPDPKVDSNGRRNTSRVRSCDGVKKASSVG